MFLSLHVYCATCHQMADGKGLIRLGEGGKVTVEVNLPSGWELGDLETAFFCEDCKLKPTNATGHRAIIGPHPARRAA